ncbi:ABC transporter substrate-binding protein [Rhodovulum sp. DZ06]|uniref:ABC transporter substrate-binding protein n=1 Tax=Rhodovulum sp. DZ06 TaxID=3425126 RepID=UPI003D357CFE
MRVVIAALRRAAAACLSLSLLASPALAAEEIAGGAPVLTVAALKVGTVNWELSTIRARGFDRANGFALKVEGMAGGPAARIAFQAGEADAMVADWIWVARQRAAGKDYVFLPYSRAVGALMVPADGAKTVAELRGGEIGIAGGPLDKSWLILRAWAEAEHGVDLAAETRQVYGAPPLIFQQAKAGRLSGAVNYWHWGAKAAAAGMRKLATVEEAAAALGLSADTPLLGYVFHGEMLREHPALLAAFARASRAAKGLMLADDAVWEGLRAQMRAASEAEFDALRAGWRAGAPGDGPVDEGAADRMLALMARLGGATLVGGADRLPAGVFVDAGALNAAAAASASADAAAATPKVRR